MKHLKSLLAIIILILAVGCEKQPAPTAADQTSSTVPKYDAKYTGPDIAKMRKLQDSKLAKIEAQNILTPESNHLKSLAKVSGNIKVPDDYATIQEAVDAAADGATINVTGSYSEDVIIYGRNDITINGGGQATLASDYFPFFVQGNSTNITIKGFSVAGSIIVVDSRGVTIKNNDISGLNDGIDVVRSNGCTISGNTIHDKTGGPVGTGDGMWLYNADSNVIASNQCYSNLDYENGTTGINIWYGSDYNAIKSNVVRDGIYGMALWGATHNSVKDCKVSNQEGVGIQVFGSNENEFNGNESFQNTTGFTVYSASGNQFIDNLTHDNYLGMFFLFDCYENVVKGAVADNNGVGLYFYSGTANNTVKDSEANGNAECDVEDYGTGNIFNNNQFGSFCTL